MPAGSGLAPGSVSPSARGRHRAVHGQRHRRGAVQADQRQRHVGAAADPQQHPHEGQLRAVPHPHDVQQAVVDQGRGSDLHARAEPGRVGDDHRIAGKLPHPAATAALAATPVAPLQPEAHRPPARQRPQRRHRVHRRAQPPPHRVGDLARHRRDARVDAARDHALRLARHADPDQVHRPHVPAGQHPGRRRRAGRDAQHPGQVVAPARRDDAERGPAARRHPGQRARHTVPADRHHHVPGVRRRGRALPGVGQRARLLHRVAHAQPVQLRRDRGQQAQRPAPARCRVDDQADQIGHGSLLTGPGIWPRDLARGCPGSGPRPGPGIWPWSGPSRAARRPGYRRPGHRDRPHPRAPRTGSPRVH